MSCVTNASRRDAPDPPTVTVAASFSKRRRQDTQILHPEVARRLTEWMATKRKLRPDALLFPVSGRVPGGTERKTHKMMQVDLRRARDEWLAAATTPEEERRRAESDFLAYENHVGQFADFHSNRHLFITSLERANISPKMAQTLARHSDVRLTLGVYTHVGVHDQVAAIGSLPAPPDPTATKSDERSVLRATGTDGVTGQDAKRRSKKVPTVVPKMVPCCLHRNRYELHEIAQKTAAARNKSLRKATL